MTNLFIVLLFWASSNGIENPKFEVSAGRLGQSVTKWDIAAPQPSMEWCSNNVDAANAWWAINDPGKQPVEFACGITLPGETNRTAMYDVVVDQATEQVLATLNHASPKKSKAEKDQKLAEKSAKLLDLKTRANASPSQAQRNDIIWEYVRQMLNATNAP